MTGHFEWDGSGLETTVNLPAGSTGTIAGPSNDKTLGGSGLGVPGTLNVSGTLNLNDLSGSGGTGLNLGAGIGRGIIRVQPGGTITSNGENDLGGQSCCGGTQNPTLVNNGTIDVTGGRLLTDAVELTQAGTVRVAAGALFDADAPTTLANSSSYTGAGELLLDLSADPTTISGTISLGTGFHLDLGPQACLQGTGTITGPGSFDFTGGDLAAALTIAKGALMHVTGPAGKDLRAFSCGTADGTVTNNGKVLVDQGALSLGGTGTITTNPGATFAIAPGATVTTDSCCGIKKLLFTKGTLQVTAPPAGVKSGTPASIDFAPLDNSGTISVASGQKLVVTGAPTTFETGTSITGVGGTTVIRAPVTAGGALTLGSKATLDLDQNGSLDGVTSVGGSGTLRWTGGTVSGTVGVASTVPVSISGEVQHAVANRPDGTASVLTTAGPVSVAAGSAKTPDTVEIGDGDQWVNAGTLTLAKNTSLGASTCCGPTPGVNNTGTMVLAASGGQVGVTTPLRNAGTLQLTSGTLALTVGSYQQTSKGTLGVTFSGTSPGTGFGRLAATVPVTLAGTLHVGTSGGFRPPAHTPFLVVSYGSRSGKFSARTGSPPYTVAYHATGMDVVFG